MARPAPPSTPRRRAGRRLEQARGVRALRRWSRGCQRGRTAPPSAGPPAPRFPRLVMAAAEISAERERLRAANEMLLGAVDTAELPLRIVEAGGALAGAGGAALGIAPAVGRDVQLAHLGLGAALVERLTRLTAGDSALEQVVDAPPGVPQPRTATLEAEPSADESWQRTLLSAPIRAGSGLYGQ